MQDILLSCKHTALFLVPMNVLFCDVYACGKVLTIAVFLCHGETPLLYIVNNNIEGAVKRLQYYL